MGRQKETDYKKRAIVLRKSVSASEFAVRNSPHYLLTLSHEGFLDRDLSGVIMEVLTITKDCTCLQPLLESRALILFRLRNTVTSKRWKSKSL